MSRKNLTGGQENTPPQPPSEHDVSVAARPPSQVAIPMRVDVDQIVPYDRNPRRMTNTAYAQIKASIRANGLDQVLSITQRSDTDQPDVYMIGAGGNTRLNAVKALWQETGDERFKQIWCQYYPWAGDTRALLAHIRENDLRSDLTFIDRAIAIQELRTLIESDIGQSLSQRELKNQLKERGYQVSQTMIHWYDYTIDTLYPVIPNVLQSGIGRTTIAKIHALQRAFGKAWAAMDLGAADDANHLFAQTLQRHDGDILDVDALRRDLEEELSVSADCDMQRASLELGAALGGPSDSDADTDPGTQASASQIKASPQPPTAPPATDTTTGENESRSAPRAKSTPPGDHGGASVPGESGASDTGRPNAYGCGDDHDPPTAPDPGQTDTKPSPPNDLKSLRSRCWTLSNRIAQGSRLGDIVVPIHAGLGFLVGPVPVDVQQSWHPEIGRSAMCVWWHLATLAEQFARHGHACAYLPEAWQSRRIGDAVRQARDSQQAFSRWQWEQADRGLFADVPALEPNDMGPMLYQSWPDPRWHDWIQLVEAYREIYRQTNNTPWGPLHHADEGV
ncbi:ParB family protein [Salinisphaera orenii]|uniref:ParB family protein n=1 Tax=Salinisphaera orenii TaxID=856731 RepID=UPI0013A62A41